MTAMVISGVALGLLALCFAAIAAASYRHFRAGDSAGNSAIRVLTAAATAGYMLLCLLRPSPEVWQSVLASALALAAFVVFRVAMRAVPDRVLDVAFTGAGPDRLIRSGIYGRVRHPLYLAYLLYWAAWVPASGLAWPTLVGLGLFASLYWMAARQEEKYLARRFGQDFAAHKHATGLFWPVFATANRNCGPTAEAGPTHEANG